MGRPPTGVVSPERPRPPRRRCATSCVSPLEESMADRQDGGPAFPVALGGVPEAQCARCSRNACRHQGHQDLCAVHYRFGQMRANAKRSGKAVPTHEQLERLMSATTSAGRLICVGCGREMNWLAVDGESTVVSLQHDRDGTLRLICRSCNTRHAFTPGDEFYSRAKSEKFCRGCERWLSKESFGVDRSKPSGLTGRCTRCLRIAQARWAATNRERINAAQRVRRAERAKGRK